MPIQFDDLPTEILEFILAWLVPIDLLEAGRSCRSLHSLLLESSTIWSGKLCFQADNRRGGSSELGEFRQLMASVPYLDKGSRDKVHSIVIHNCFAADFSRRHLVRKALDRIGGNNAMQSITLVYGAYQESQEPIVCLYLSLLARTGATTLRSVVIELCSRPNIHDAVEQQLATMGLCTLSLLSAAFPCLDSLFISAVLDETTLYLIKRSWPHLIRLGVDQLLERVHRQLPALQQLIVFNTPLNHLLNDYELMADGLWRLVVMAPQLVTSAAGNGDVSASIDQHLIFDYFRQTFDRFRLLRELCVFGDFFTLFPELDETSKWNQSRYRQLIKQLNELCQERNIKFNWSDLRPIPDDALH